jgi:hypothetical protein
MHEISLNLILTRIRIGWRTPAVITVTAVAFALYTLANARPMYHVEMTVIPAPNTNGENIPNIGGTIGTLLNFTGGAQAGTDYVRYQRLIMSPVVAQRLQDRYGMLQKVFSSQWDNEHRRWVAPPSMRRTLLGWLFSLAHVPSWSPPDAIALSGYLQGQFVIIPSPTSDLVQISIDAADPVFARRLLVAAHTEANGLLRDQIARRAHQQVQYLDSKLQQTTVADYRATLLALLSSQEKTLMMTQTDASFAAEIVNPPMFSPVPVSPRPVLSIAVAILAGMLSGFAIVVFLGPDWWRIPLSWFRSVSIEGVRNRNDGTSRQA